jgi:hypothetical protein
MINQAIPPIIERKVDRTGDPNPIPTPTHLGIGQAGVRPYQPNLQNFQPQVQVASSRKPENDKTVLKIEGKKYKLNSKDGISQQPNKKVVT